MFKDVKEDNKKKMNNSFSLDDEITDDLFVDNEIESELNLNETKNEDIFDRNSETNDGGAAQCLVG